MAPRDKGTYGPVKNAHLGGHQDLIIDVSVVHEFGGDHMVDVSRNGLLRDTDP